ncbi:unnamed protein product [Protopolystoma xenopodis]|uniref:Uncharacterized protein n=1 Tax=Protopolystoma xenopodis TaxID=117903 RepID=A0A3S5ABA2_9PLAT|nr:unnamed protein product [Protopolystoma xenopodis]
MTFYYGAPLFSVDICSADHFADQATPLASSTPSVVVVDEYSSIGPQRTTGSCYHFSESHYTKEVQSHLQVSPQKHYNQLQSVSDISQVCPPPPQPTDLQTGVYFSDGHPHEVGNISIYTGHPGRSVFFRQATSDKCHLNIIDFNSPVSCISEGELNLRRLFC